ncbi:phosphotransferase [candidate division WOR-3 bacterium]|nr:phosphotransferase [candidate division WOR-3 bacterium]
MQQIIDAYSDAVLDEAAKRFGIDKAKLKRLHSFENFIYEFERDGAELILRLTHSSDMSADFMQGETEWVSHLASNGVSVACPVPSPSGNLVEVIDASGSGLSYFSSTVSPKVKGVHLLKPQDYTDEVITNWGRVLGRMHALAKDYEPSSERIRRPHWDEGEEERARKYLPRSQPRVMQRWHELVEHARTLDTGKDSYGLVHDDLYSMNFLVNDREITVIDFGDSRYDWFANDLAIPIFYVVREHWFVQPDNDFVRRFMRCILEGYLSENTLESRWLSEIGFFHKLRELLLYITLYAEGMKDLDPWSERFMQGRRESIEQSTPIIEADFSHL